MFDFIGYTRDAEIDITIRHPAKGIYTSLDVRDKHSGFYEHYDITDKEAASCGNIYTHIGIVLDKDGGTYRGEARKAVRRPAYQ